MWQKVFTLSAITTIVVVLLSYQNCGAPIPEAGQDKLTSLAENAPFAFDLTINHITYMSCVRAPDKSSADASSAFFTFRAGAYDNPGGTFAGLKLSDDFITYAQEELRKNNQTGYPYPSQLKDLLMSSVRNKGAKPIFSIRGRTNVDQILLGQNGSPTVNRDYMAVWDSLTTSEFATEIVKMTSDHWGNESLPDRYNYYEGSGVVGTGFRKLEASLYFNSSGLEMDLRRQLKDAYYLTFAYQSSIEDAEAFLLRTPDEFVVEENEDGTSTTGGTSNKLAYGTAYMVDFSQAFTNLYTNPQSVLKSVQEFDLEGQKTQSDMGTWSCPSGFRILLVDPEDADTMGPSINGQAAFKICQLKADYNGSDAAIQLRYQLIRRHLPIQDWYLNLDPNGDNNYSNDPYICAVPKATMICYGSSVQYKPIYFPSEGNACEPGVNCAHWASMCFRTTD